jgi:hypothetical protein
MRCEWNWEERAMGHRLLALATYLVTRWLMNRAS